MVYGNENNLNIFTSKEQNKNFIDYDEKNLFKLENEDINKNYNLYESVKENNISYLKDNATEQNKEETKEEDGEFETEFIENVEIDYIEKFTTNDLTCETYEELVDFVTNGTGSTIRLKNDIIMKFDSYKRIELNATRPITIYMDIYSIYIKEWCFFSAFGDITFIGDSSKKPLFIIGDEFSVHNLSPGGDFYIDHNVKIIANSDDSIGIMIVNRGSINFIYPQIILKGNNSIGIICNSLYEEYSIKNVIIISEKRGNIGLKSEKKLEVENSKILVDIPTSSGDKVLFINCILNNSENMNIITRSDYIKNYWRKTENGISILPNEEVVLYGLSIVVGLSTDTTSDNQYSIYVDIILSELPIDLSIPGEYLIKASPIIDGFFWSKDVYIPLKIVDNSKPHISAGYRYLFDRAYLSLFEEIGYVEKIIVKYSIDDEKTWIDITDKKYVIIHEDAIEIIGLEENKDYIFQIEFIGGEKQGLSNKLLFPYYEDAFDRDSGGDGSGEDREGIDILPEVIEEEIEENNNYNIINYFDKFFENEDRKVIATNDVIYKNDVEEIKEEKTEKIIIEIPKQKKQLPKLTIVYPENQDKLNDEKLNAIEENSFIMNDFNEDIIDNENIDVNIKEESGNVEIISSNGNITENLAVEQPKNTNETLKKQDSKLKTNESKDLIIDKNTLEKMIVANPEKITLFKNGIKIILPTNQFTKQDENIENIIVESNIIDDMFFIKIFKGNKEIIYFEEPIEIIMKDNNIDYIFIKTDMENKIYPIEMLSGETKILINKTGEYNIYRKDLDEKLNNLTNDVIDNKDKPITNFYEKENINKLSLHIPIILLSSIFAIFLMIFVYKSIKLKRQNKNE